MASPTQWTWVWVNSRSWRWTGRPGMLKSMGLQGVRHDWVTELNWTGCFYLFNLHIFLKCVWTDFSNIERKFPIWPNTLFLELWFSFLAVMTARQRPRKEHVYNQPRKLGFKRKIYGSMLLNSRPWGQVPLMEHLFCHRHCCVLYVEYLNCLASFYS